MIKQNIRIATILLAILLIVIGIGIGIAKANTRVVHLQRHELPAVSLHELGDVRSSLLLNPKLEVLEQQHLPLTLASRVLKSDHLLDVVENVKVLHPLDANDDLLTLGV